VTQDEIIQFADHQAAPDYRALDTVLPHPAYGQQAWISVVCPGPGPATWPAPCSPRPATT
jgi:hypothetical protein